VNDGFDGRWILKSMQVIFSRIQLSINVLQ